MGKKFFKKFQDHEYADEQCRAKHSIYVSPGNGSPYTIFNNDVV
ncbi:hypothetical protein CSB93_3356 [Pseudomonas paraeruginosa]|uniref:Uncharacterized protein n=1 Tax=Pseudomonas paraeruginosa TaxID=2994495 RepID=A0A2R3IVQ5_9PSED|nr:hypothetical protein CSB93_3356 [Pseudomonas paraeruginosa]AWE90940.1 hypothetical protein CSC28_2134 [Pseudomonas paraeruginosa]